VNGFLCRVKIAILTTLATIVYKICRRHGKQQAIAKILYFDPRYIEIIQERAFCSVLEEWGRGCV
jgi:hypothetical protein